MHTHKFTRSKSSATVETCPCGRFRFTEHAGPSIVGQPLFPGPIQTDDGRMVNVQVNGDGTLSI